MIIQHTMVRKTPGRGLIDITADVLHLVEQKEIVTGLCNIFLHHTSASLLINENHDPSVLMDLEAFMGRLVPDGDPLFEHTAEGLDDMPSHVRSILTQSSLTIPMAEKKCLLGTWQGIFLWEHRLKSHQRKLTITLVGTSISH